MSDPIALRSEARAARSEGRAADAIALEIAAATALAAAGDAAGEAHALRHAADMLSETGDPAAAEPFYRHALAHYGQSLSLDSANALRGAALNAERLGDAREASVRWEAARAAYAANDAMLRERASGNPGLTEAEARLAALGPG